MKKILKNIGLFAFSFMLLILQPLKTYAAAPAPVIPEGFNPVVIQGGGAGSPVPVSPDIISTLLVALGIQIEDIVRSKVENYIGSPEENVASIFDDPTAQESLWEAFNEADTNNHSLGDELSSWLKSSQLTKSQNGHISKLEVPRDLWDRLITSTSDGISIELSTSESMDTYSQFIAYAYNKFNLNSNENFDEYMFSTPVLQFVQPNRYGRLVTYFAFGFTSYTYSNNSLNITYPSPGVKFYAYCWDESSILYGQQSDIHSYGNVLSCEIISGNITQPKKLNVSEPFKNAKLNNNYDVIGKSSTINPNTGKIEGPVRMSVLNAQQLQQLQDLINQGILTIGEALNRLNLFAYDQNSGILIDNNLSPEQALNSLAQGASDPSPTQPTLEESFEVIDGWDPVVPAPDLPFTGGMSWLAAQMQTLLTLTNFQNIWLVISTLAVAMLIIGMKRLWK